VISTRKQNRDLYTYPGRFFFPILKKLLGSSTSITFRSLLSSFPISFLYYIKKQKEKKNLSGEGVSGEGKDKLQTGTEKEKQKEDIQFFSQR
jgi:hypothetical protein